MNPIISGISKIKNVKTLVCPGDYLKLKEKMMRKLFKSIMGMNLSMLRLFVDHDVFESGNFAYAISKLASVKPLGDWSWSGYSKKTFIKT